VGGVSSQVVKRTFPDDINDEHPHRYSKKGHFGKWKRVSDSLQALDDVVQSAPPKDSSDSDKSSEASEASDK
jgi:hypothetical protein